MAAGDSRFVELRLPPPPPPPPPPAPGTVRWIDPSGVVVDTAGNPVESATVVLSASDTIEGPFEPVPEGSEVMSPDNRANPDVTDAAGGFRWDVIAG
jgi:hypothetical protein